MVKSTKRHFRLEDGEYIITGAHPHASKYKVYYNNVDVTHTVTAIVRLDPDIVKKLMIGINHLRKRKSSYSKT